MESFNVNISKRDIDALVEETINTADLLARLLQPGTANFKLLKAAIERENAEFGGSPQMGDFSIEDSHFTSNAGKFRIKYQVMFDFTCSAFKKQKENQTSDWTFQ